VIARGSEEGKSLSIVHHTSILLQELDSSGEFLIAYIEKKANLN